MRRVSGITLLLLGSFLTLSTGMANAQTSDDQALTIARQVITDLNKGDYDTLFTRFDDTMSRAITKDQLKAVWDSIARSAGEYVGETAHSITEIQGFKVVTLTLQFKNGALNAIVSVNGKGQVGGLNFRPAAPPTPASYDLAPDEQEITFTSGGDTFYGTLLIPANHKGRVPAVLMLSGSGPTDRDGNSTLLQGKIDSHKTFARILAKAGVASLRYDKLGTGKTGLGSHQAPGSLTFDLYVDTALAGYAFLAGRPEVDPSRMAILGHSEGGLIALVAADKMKPPPAALMLFAPISKPYMQTLREQVAAQYADAVAAGAKTQKEADDGLAELDQIIAQVMKDGTTPATMSSQWALIFSPGNLKFLQTVSRYVPADLAQGLPPTLKVLVLCGEKDQQVPCADVKVLVDGFTRGGNTGVQFFELVNVNHVFREIVGTPNVATDYTDPSKSFSSEATTRITDFVASALTP